MQDNIPLRVMSEYRLKIPQKEKKKKMENTKRFFWKTEDWVLPSFYYSGVIIPSTKLRIFEEEFLHSYCPQRILRVYTDMF